MSRQPLSIIACVLALLFVGTIYGWTETETGSWPFTRTGKLLSLSGDSALIEDARYVVSNTMRVYVFDPSAKDPKKMRENGRSLATREAIQVGMTVGYTVEGEGGGKQGTITELWVLPAGGMPALQSKE